MSLIHWTNGCRMMLLAPRMASATKVQEDSQDHQCRDESRVRPELGRCTKSATHSREGRQP
ncbi:MAG: hypothetical protein ACREOG_04410, partial [Gemmatimonadaceae bacterium]